MGTATICACVAILAVSLMLGACVGPYATYAPYSITNLGGYTETEVQPGVFLVQFIGNEHTPPDRPADFALLRAADLCLQRGKNYMFVGSPARHYMATGTISGTTTVVPASETSQLVSTMPPTLPVSPIGGVMVSCTETQASGAWDAQFLARAIRTKYSIS
ncbi:MAG TPA: hypothetical protein VIT67_13925 [Povalibacter sp.]